MGAAFLKFLMSESRLKNHSLAVENFRCESKIFAMDDKNFDGVARKDHL